MKLLILDLAAGDENAIAAEEHAPDGILILHEHPKSGLYSTQLVVFFPVVGLNMSQVFVLERSKEKGHHAQADSAPCCR